MAGDGQSLGKAKVEITADTTQFNASVDAAKAKLGDLGTAGKASGDDLWDSMMKAGDGADQAGQKIGKAVTETESLLSKVGGALQSLSSMMPAIAAAGIAAFAAIKYAVDKKREAVEEANKKLQEQLELYLKLEQTISKGLHANDDPLSKSEKMAQELVEAGWKFRELVRMGASGDQLQSAYRGMKQLEAEIAEQRKKEQDAEEKKKQDAAKKAADEQAKIDKEEHDRKAKTLLELSKLQAESASDYLKMLKEAEKVQERIGQIMLRDTLAAASAMERLYASQQRGFGASDAGGSLAAQINNLTEEMRRISLRSNGAVN